MSDYALPITIAVTGHRDPANPQAVKRAIDEILALLEARFAHTPLQALSPLAEGADRLFAEVALDRGIPLDVILPLRQEVYERDFPASIDTFRALLARAREIGTLEAVEGHEDAAGSAGGISRDLHYAQAGLHVASHSQILIALWDGGVARGVGGTAQVVSARLEGWFRMEHVAGAEKFAQFGEPSPIDQPETGVVCWLKIRRSHHDEERAADVEAPQWAIDPHGWHKVLPQRGSTHGTSLAHLDELDEYNQAVTTQLRSLERSEWIDAAQKSPDVAGHSALVSRLYGRHLAADALATQTMQDARRRFAVIFGLAGLMAAAFELWAHVLPSYLMLLTYIVILGMIGVLIWRLRRTEAHEHAVDWRVLAEGLRVQTFWVVSGLPDQVSRHYMRRHGPILQWVRTALSGVLPVPPDCAQAGGSAVLKHWIEAQRDYYAKRVNGNRARMHVLLSASRCAYWTSIAIAIGMLLATLPFVNLLRAGGSLDRGVVIVFMGLLPVLAGLLNGYVEFAGYKDQAREYGRMHQLFRTAADAALPLIAQLPGSVSARRRFQRIVRELGIEALREQADWALLHKAHEIEIPKG